MKRGASASGSRVVGGRVVAMPFAALDEVKSFTGEVAPSEVRKAKEGPFARYMQRIYAKTGISDGPSVLRKLIGLLVALAWIGEAVVCTFRAPFTVTGNGYFASWFGVVAALLYLAEQ